MISNRSEPLGVFGVRSGAPPPWSTDTSTIVIHRSALLIMPISGRDQICSTSVELGNRASKSQPHMWGDLQAVGSGPFCDRQAMLRLEARPRLQVDRKWRTCRAGPQAQICTHVR
jgi:hypothetical protein